MIKSRILLFISVICLLASCDKDVINWNSDPFKGDSYISDLKSPISTFLSEQEDFAEYVKTL